MKRIRIVNQKRFMLSMTLLMSILFFIIWNLLAVINRVEGYQAPKYKEVIVKSGDTVWELIRENGSKNIDIRKTIYEISIINNLDTYDIFPGQIIKLPIE